MDIPLFFIFFIIFYSFFSKILFLFREGEGKEKEREKNISVCNWLPLTHTPNWGPHPRPRQLP